MLSKAYDGLLVTSSRWCDALDRRLRLAGNWTSRILVEQFYSRGKLGTTHVRDSTDVANGFFWSKKHIADRHQLVG